MSWHFSRALVAEYLAANSSDGELSARLKLKPTPSAFLCKDRMTAFSRRSLSGMTFTPLTENRGEEKLISLLVDFLVKRSAQQRTENLPPMICGPKCEELSTKSVQISYSEKMFPSKQSVGRLKSANVMVMKPKSSLFPLATWAQTIKGLGIGSLPRVTCAANFLSPSMYKHEGCRNYIRVFGLKVQRDGKNLLKWPTRDKAAKDQEKQDHWAQRWPYEIGQHPRPNPLDLEWLMGWPAGWTDIKPLGTGKFQQWRQRHFKSSTNLLEKRTYGRSCANK